MSKGKRTKAKNYMAILDRPIEELKKPIGQPVEFGVVIGDVIRYNPKKKKK